jgi:hypothetical protein
MSEPGAADWSRIAAKGGQCGREERPHQWDERELASMPVLLRDGGSRERSATWCYNSHNEPKRYANYHNYRHHFLH